MTPQRPEPDDRAAASADPPSTPTIPTRPRPDCPGCRGSGEVRYQGLTDRLFGAPGKWTMRECRDAQCGMLWLDPGPHPDHLASLYDDYYTHDDPAARTSSARSLYARVVDAYVARRFGYPVSGGSARERWLSRLLPLFPGRRSLAEAGVAGLPYRPGGRLLEVGCGGGAALARLRGVGWDVEGLDFDPRAVRNARAKGLEVQVGALPDAGYPEKSFDAVVASHVIEHLPEPSTFLAAALRVLRPSGTLILDTPNAGSHARRRFGPNWRGLEPPRHLMLFTPSSLERMARAAGFGAVRWQPVEYGGVLTLHSRMLRDLGRIDPRRDARIRLAHEFADLAEWARTRASPASAQVFRLLASAE